MQIFLTMMKTSNQLDLLKLVNNKLEVKRDELMDVINSSLSSFLPDRVKTIYDAQLELATVEKALEINRFFQIQIQEELLSSMLNEEEVFTKKSDGEKEDNSNLPKDSEELKK
jgi:hypothetical protein